MSIAPAEREWAARQRIRARRALYTRMGCVEFRRDGCTNATLVGSLEMRPEVSSLVSSVELRSSQPNGLLRLTWKAQTLSLSVISLIEVFKL